MPHYRATPESHAVDRRRRPAADRLRRPVPRRHHRHHPRVADRQRQRGAEARLHAGAEGHDRPVARPLPARHAVADARRHRARAAVGARPRLRPRHRPRRRLLPQRARRPAEHLARHSRRRHGDGARHDHRVEPGLYRPGQWGVRIENLVLNVPAAELAERVRRVPRVRDADAVPDRHPLHRPRAAARRRDRLAECYHATVRERLAPLVSGDALAWLQAAHRPLASGFSAFRPRWRPALGARIRRASAQFVRAQARLRRKPVSPRRAGP